MDKQEIEGFKDNRGLIWWFGQTDIGFNFEYITSGTIEPDCKRGGHYHKEISEKIFCVKGKLLVILDEEEIFINGGDLVDIPAGKMHTVVNIGNETAFFLEIKAKEITNENKDTHYRR